MAFNTYADLKTSLANWLADNDLSSYLDDFITLAEDRLARDLRIRAMELALSDTIASGVISVPAGFLELKHARIQAQSRNLEPKDAQWIYRKYPLRSADSLPQFIGVDNTTFVFGPFPDATYAVSGTYYAKPATCVGGTTNVWTDTCPDALLFASLLEVEPFNKNDKRIAVWQTKYDQIVNRLNNNEKRQMRRGTRVSYN